MSRTSRLFSLFFVVVLGVSALYVSLPGAPVAQAQAGVPSSAVIAPASQSLPNNGTTGNVTVTILDSLSAGVPNIPVTLSPGTFPAGVTVNPVSGNTNASGVFTATVSSVAPVATTASITLTATYFYNSTTVNVTGSALVNFTQAPASPTYSTISADPQVLQANNVVQTTVRVEMKDINQTGTPNKSVTLNVTSGGSEGLTFDPTTPATQTTGANGILEWRIRSSIAKVVQFTANNTTDGFSEGPQEVTFTPASPDHGTAVADPTTAQASGIDPVTITVTVFSAGSLPLENSTVNLTGSYPSYLTIATADNTTDAAGVVTYTVTSTQALAGQAFTFQATGPGPGSINLTSNAVTFTEAPAIQAKSSITGAQTAPADGVTTRDITVTLINAGDNPVVNRSVTLTANPATGVTINSGANTTDSNGEITFTVSSLQTGLVTFTTNTIDGFTLSTTVDFTVAPADAGQSTVVRSPATGDIAGDGLTEVIVTVTLLNAGGGPVAGHIVTLAPTVAAPVTITPDAGLSDPDNGIHVFRVTAVTSSAPVSVTLQATDNTQGLALVDDTVTINFVVPPADAALSSVAVTGEVPPNPLGVEANGVATATITVTVVDRGNNPLPGKQITLLPSPAAGVTFNAPGATTNTNGSGVATFVVKSTSIALVTFTARVDTDSNLNITDTAQVNFTAAPATQATITVNPLSAPANGQLSGEITIRVVLRDAGGNPAVGKLLFLDATAAPNPGAIIYTTNAFQATALVSGEAVAEWKVRSSVAQAVNFAIVNQTDPAPYNDVGDALATWVASANPVSGANSSIAVSPTTANADNAETVTITAILRDSTNTVVQGKNAQLVVNTPLPGGATLLPAVQSGPSNSAGEVTWTLRSPTAGTFTFTATVSSDGVFINNVTPGGSNTVTFNPVGSAVSATNSSVVVVSGNPALANGTAAITLRVTLRDASNNPLPGLAASLSSSRGGQDAIAPGSINTDASGVADFTVTSNTAGTATITAIGDGITLSAHPNITFNPLGSPVDPANSSIAVSGPAIANGVAQITVVVTLRDAANAAVAGQIVTLSSSRGSPVPDNIQPAFQTSAADGTAQFTITSTTAGSGTLTAVGGGTTLASNPQFTFNPVVSPVDPATSTVSVSPASVPANGTSAILVTVTVRQGATPLNGILVSVSTNPAVTVSAVSATTNGSGVAQFELRSTVAHPSVTVIAVADGVTINQQPVVAFSALPVNADTSTIAANPLSVAANGVATSTITVTARDVNNNPVSGKTVVVSSSRGVTDTIAPQSAGSNVTDINGQARFTVRSNTIGNAVMSASADAVNLTNTVSVGFTSGVAVNGTTSTISAAPTSAPADGTTPIVVTVTARDASNNPLSGQSVTLSSAPAGVTFNPTTALTDGSGVATFNLTSTSAGARTITAVAGGVTLTNTAAITFTGVAAVSPTLSTITAAPASVAADGTTPITITVTVRDTGGVALAGRVVTISSSRGATDTITTLVGTSNGSGQATFEVRSATVGSPVISAVAGGVNLTNTVTIGFASTAAVSPTLSTIQAQNSPQPAGGTPITVVVNVRDGANAALVGKSVTITATPNTGITITPGGGTTVSDASGNATFQVSSPNQGIITISAVADSVALTNTAQITFSAPLGPPDLAITKSGQATFNAGVASPFILAVNNVGSGPTTGTITVTDNLPVGMRFWGTLGDTQGFSCGAAGQLVTCTRGTALAQGGVASVQILANPDPAFFTTAQNLSNTASVSVPGDTNAANNTSGALFFNVTPINLNQIFEGNSTVTVNPTTVPADNTSVATITITLRNIQNQGVAGATVTLTPSVVTGITVASTTPTTDGNGAISFTAKSSVNQTVTFTIIATSSAGSVTFANHPQVIFGSGGTGGTGGTGTTGVTSPTTSTVLADCSAIPANNVAQAIVQVTLKDAAGNPLAGRAVTLTANPAPATLLLTPVSGTTTAADGTVRWTVRSSAQGSSIFTASTTDGSLIFINQTATVTFGAPNSQSVCTGLPTTTTGTAVAGVTDPNLLTVPTGPITGRVVAWRLRVRTGPGLDYQILGLLRLGTEVSIVARNSRTTWFMIQLEEGTAWVSAWWIRVTRTSVRRLPVVDDQPGTAPIVPVPSQLIPLVGEGIGRINTYLLRVRVGPGLEYQQVGLLREGTEVLLLGISPNRAWYKIRTDDGDRWVSAFYVRVIRINGARLPVVEPEPRP